MANLDEFNLQLSGELDQQKSKTNVDSDIAKLEKAIEHLKLQAEIDPKSAQNIAKQLSDILNQKVVVDNIQIDAGKVTKPAQQVGQKIGDTVEKSVQQSLNIDDVIDKQVTDLMSKYSIAGKKGSKAFDEIRQAVINYRKELATVSDFDPDDEFSFFSNSADIRKVTSALTDHMKVADATKDTYASLAEYIKAVNNSGTKIHLPESIRQEYGDDFSSMRSQLGKAFTTGKGGDFESFVTELNGQLGNVIDLSQGAEAAFGDLVQKVNSAKGGNFLSGNELFNQGVLDRSEIEKNITSAINIIDEEEKKLAQTSTSTSNTVVQNEQKKQQAYQQTANAQKQVVESESLIKSDANVATFDHTKNAAREASEYFQQLLKDENAVISVSERFGQLNGLTSFTVNVKRATGEVESLRYALKPILDSDGNETGEFYFGNVGAELNNSGAIKQIKDIENAFSDYTAKLSQFKSTNSEILSGLTTPLSDFETKLTGLKNGTSTIDEVANAYKSLNAEASNITKNFSRQLSPIDSAIRNLAKGEETISGLRAEFKGLNNAPKEINTELTKCAKLLENVKKIESQEGRTENWSQAYRQWSDSVDTLQAKLKTLRKEQSNVASTQIFNTSDLKNNNIAYMSKVYNTIEKQMVEINRLAKAKDWQIVDVSGVEQADGKIKKLTLTVRDAEGALKKLDMQREKLQGNGKAQYGLMQVGDVKILETASQAQEKLAQSTEKANAKLAEQANKIQLSFANGDYNAKVESTIAKTQQWRDENENARISTEQLRTALANLGTAYNNLNADGGDTIANQKVLKQAESELSAEIKRVTNEVTKMNAEYAKSSKVESFHQKLTEFYDKNTATHRKWGAELKQMMDATASGAKVTNSELLRMELRYEEIGNKARQAGKLGLSFFDSIKEQAKKFTQWVSVTSVVMEGVQAVKQLISVSKELDTVMTDFTMATGTTGSKLEALTESYSKLADKLKSTTTDVMTSATEWIKQGQSIADTETLVSNSMILSKIGKLDSADATKYLTSAMKGYKVSVDDTLSVVDKLSAVDMASATDVGGLAEGMSEVAASADLAGVSMDKLLGYLAAIGETTQSGMSEVGTTLNAVFSRMGNIKLSRLKDYDNNGEDLSNVETVLRGVGISLRDSANSFRDFDKVLDETANNWSNYSDVQQRAIASAFAGTHHMNEFIVLMENYDKALEYTEKSLNSSGEAMDKFSAYEKSVEAHTESFTNAIQSLSDTAVDSGLINFFVDLGTTGVKAIDGIVNALTPLGTAAAIGGGILGGKNLGKVYKRTFSYCFEYALYA